MKRKNRLFVFLFCIIAALVASPLQAADYYVDSQAADDTGNGAIATPKKYIKSGVALLAAGDTLNIRANGANRIYNEEDNAASDSFLLIPAKASTTTIQRDARDAAYTVTINGKPAASGGHATLNICIGQVGGAVTDAKLVFNNLIFQSPASTKLYTVLIGSGGVTFSGCTFKAVPGSTGTFCCGINPYADTTTAIAFTSCVFTYTAVTTPATDLAHGIKLSTDAKYISGVTLTDCTATLPGTCIYSSSATLDRIWGVTILRGTFITIDTASVVTNQARALRIANYGRTGETDALTITNATFENKADFYGASIENTANVVISGCRIMARAPGLVLGTDSAPSTGAVGGTIDTCTIAGDVEALLLGYGVDGVTVTNCALSNKASLGEAVVLKNCSNVTIDKCSIYCGFLQLTGSPVVPSPLAAGAVFCKGAVDTAITNCRFLVDYSAAFYTTANPENNQKNENITFTGNTIICGNMGSVYLVAPNGYATDHTGTLVVNNNKFIISDNADYGSIGTVADISTLINVRAAWATLDAGYSANDSGSYNLGSSGGMNLIGGGTKLIGQ